MCAYVCVIHALPSILIFLMVRWCSYVKKCIIMIITMIIIIIVVREGDGNIIKTFERKPLLMKVISSMNTNLNEHRFIFFSFFLFLLPTFPTYYTV